MTEDQAIAVRDALIGEQNAGESPLAVKFQGWLLDRISDVKASDEVLAEISEECRTFILGANDQAMTALRAELKNDPDQRGYAGKTPEELQVLLTTEVVITERVTKPPSQYEMIKRAVADYLGKDYAAPAPEMMDVVMETKPPRVSVIWDQIPYCRNLPTLDNIAEALK